MVTVQSEIFSVPQPTEQWCEGRLHDGGQAGQQQLDDGGCAVVSSTSNGQQEQGQHDRSVRQHDNIGSIITMLIADQVWQQFKK